MVRNIITNIRREPLPLERERAMGCFDNYTKAPEVLEKNRHELLGRVMDPYTLQFIIELGKCATARHNRFAGA